MSRPHEWFQILSHGLQLGDGALAERNGQMAKMAETLAAESALRAERAAEEFESELQLHGLKQQQVASEAAALRQQISNLLTLP